MARTLSLPSFAWSDMPRCRALPIAIGPTRIRLISIPVTNRSVDPARSTAAGRFAETDAHGRLWPFRLAPLLGAAAGAAGWAALRADRPDGATRNRTAPPAAPVG